MPETNSTRVSNIFSIRTRNQADLRHRRVVDNTVERLEVFGTKVLRAHLDGIPLTSQIIRHEAEALVSRITREVDQPCDAPRKGSLERAGQDVLSAIVDFSIALKTAHAHREVSRIYNVLHQCVAGLAILESAALDRADALTSQPDYTRGA